MKKKLTDIAVGPANPQASSTPYGADPDISEHDYSHVLPKTLSTKGYKMKVIHVKGGDVGRDGLHVAITHPGAKRPSGEIGNIEGSFKVGRINGIHGGHAMVGLSNVDSDHQGKGLGLAMYQAFYAHAKNALGATHASSDAPHSSMASAVHGKLARLHGLDYKAKPHLPEGQTMEDWNATRSGSFDDKFGPYSYTLKSEVLAKSEDEILRMMAIPEERSLALKMSGCRDGHLAVALQHEDLRDSVLEHKSMGPITQHAILSNPSMESLWHKMLGGSLSVDQLDTLRQTCLGMDCEDDVIGKILGHPNVGAPTLNSLIDMGHGPALGHSAVDKAVLDHFVLWHIQFPTDPVIADMARAALANPMTSESCYELAMRVPDRATKMAVLATKFYLPKGPTKDVLLRGSLEDPEMVLTIVNHRLIDQDLLEIAAQDQSASVRTIAKQKLLPIYKAAGLDPEDIIRKLAPRVHERP